MIVHNATVDRLARLVVVDFGPAYLPVRMTLQSACDLARATLKGEGRDIEVVPTGRPDRPKYTTDEILDGGYRLSAAVRELFSLGSAA